MFETRIFRQMGTFVVALALIFAACAPSVRADSKIQIMTQRPTSPRSRRKSAATSYCGVRRTRLPGPHFVEAKPSFLLKLRHADLLIVVGLELENRLAPAAHHAVTNPKIQVGAPGYFDASRFARILEMPTGAVTRAEGERSSQGNPHYWLDPDNVCASPKASADKAERDASGDSPISRNATLSSNRS